VNVAIVGSSHINTTKEDFDVRQSCETILKEFVPIETTIITGGAKGVDSIAQEIGLLNGFAVKPIFPMGIGTKANLQRNIEIAKECDQLFCISIPTHNKKCYHHFPPQDHEKTAGCWTLDKAKQAGKKCKLIIAGLEFNKQ